MPSLSRILLTLTLGLALAAPSAAATLSSHAIMQFGLDLQSDVAPPQEGGVVLSQETSDYQPACDLKKKASVGASMSDAGVSAAFADGAFLEPTPTDGPMDLNGRASWTETLTNNDAVPQLYSFNYNLFPSIVQLCDPQGISGDTGNATVPDGEAPAAGFRIRGFRNEVLIVEIFFEVRGGGAGHTLTETGPSVGPSLFTDGNDIVGYNITGVSGSVDLGLLLPGASIKLDYSIEAWATSPGYDLGAYVQIGDPLDLGGNPGLHFFATLEEDPVSTEDSSWGQVKSRFN